MIPHLEKVWKLHIKADFKGQELVIKHVNPTLFSKHIGQDINKIYFSKEQCILKNNISLRALVCKI